MLIHVYIYLFAKICFSLHSDSIIMRINIAGWLFSV